MVPRFIYLGHSTVLCELPSGQTILIDPWTIQNPSFPSGFPIDRIDAMLITHGHFDHIGDAVTLAQQYWPNPVVGTVELCAWLESQGVQFCSGMNLGGTQQVLGTRVTQVQALHTSSIMDSNSTLYGDTATGYVVRLDSGFTFYHAGDTALFGDMQLIADLYRPNLAFLPIGDHYTMDPEQAALACKLLGVTQVVPIHWGTFPILTGTPEMLAHNLDALGVNCEMIILGPGESFIPQ